MFVLGFIDTVDNVKKHDNDLYKCFKHRLCVIASL